MTSTHNESNHGSPQAERPSVWPAQQKIETFMRDPTVLITDFQDTESYHPGLVRRILELEQDPAFSHGPVFGGRKIMHVDRWGCPEADLIHARALEFFRRITNKAEPEVDLCWASISRAGDYLGPHSHTRRWAVSCTRCNRAIRTRSDRCWASCRSSIRASRVSVPMRRAV